MSNIVNDTTIDVERRLREASAMSEVDREIDTVRLSLLLHEAANEIDYLRKQLNGKEPTNALCEEANEKEYTPGRCWFRNGYVTRQTRDLVRQSLANGDEMSEEDVALVCAHMGFYEGCELLNTEQVGSKLGSRLETTIGAFQNNKLFTHEDEEFAMRLLGWRDYCLMMHVVSHGGNVALRSHVFDGRYCYYIVQA